MKTCVTWIDLSRSLKVKDNGAIWNLTHDFLSIINSNSVVILYRFGLVWFIGVLMPQQQPGSYQGGEMMMMKSVIRPLKTCVTWIDLSSSLKVKENSAKWNFIYDFLYVNNGN